MLGVPTKTCRPPGTAAYSSSRRRARKSARFGAVSQVFGTSTSSQITTSARSPVMLAAMPFAASMDLEFGPLPDRELVGSPMIASRRLQARLHRMALDDAFDVAPSFLPERSRPPARECAGPDYGTAARRKTGRRELTSRNCERRAEATLVRPPASGKLPLWRPSPRLTSVRRLVGCRPRPSCP